MSRSFRRSRVLPYALMVLATWSSTVGRAAGEREIRPEPQVGGESLAPATTFATSDISWEIFSPASWFSSLQQSEPDVDRLPSESAAWNDTAELPEPSPADAPTGSAIAQDSPLDNWAVDQRWSGDWSWQWLPAGLIYRSYLAGVHEPRMALVVFYEEGDRTLWDATLGGRVGLLRYGDCDPNSPQGCQLDFYGAAISRLDVEHRQDLDSTDYVFGVPLTYGIGNWQFKFAYAHLSSHLGDELALRDPDTLGDRINYVRDAIVFGASCYPHPVWRQYAEVGWAFHNSGGAQPWEAQLGSELSLPGPTGRAGTPFLAVNGRMREEHHFGGDVSVQAGWLRRGVFGQTLRFGAHYYNGKSSQFQFFDNFEEQIGLGLWYDF